MPRPIPEPAPVTTAMWFCKSPGMVPPQILPKDSGIEGSLLHWTARSQPMCRNIKTLFNFEPPATHDEIHASALQFVRKLSGFNKPSQANTAAFERAVHE